MNSTTFVLFDKLCLIVDQLGSKDSSRDFQLNCVISYFFYLHLMLHANVQKLMWWREWKNLEFRGNLNKTSLSVSGAASVLGQAACLPALNGCRCMQRPLPRVWKIPRNKGSALRGDLIKLWRIRTAPIVKFDVLALSPDHVTVHRVMDATTAVFKWTAGDMTQGNSTSTRIAL